jgi:2-phospho-L-lactate guanylyltransferase
MACSIIIPVKPISEGKSRLAPALPPLERAELNRRLFTHVLEVAARAVGRSCVSVVTRDFEFQSLARGRGVRAVCERRPGQNAALHQAAGSAPADRPILALSADLPFLAADDLETMIGLGGQHDVVAARSADGGGTNALLMRRPLLMPYLFGPSSLAKHRHAAARRELTFQTIGTAGLGCDLDFPDQIESALTALAGSTALDQHHAA